MPSGPYDLLHAFYLLTLIAFTCLSAVLYYRANRTVIYYPQITCCLLIILSLMLKLLQWQAPPQSILYVLIFIDSIVWSTALLVIFMAYHAAITRSRLPLILQMICGAAALLLASFLLTGTGATFEDHVSLNLTERLMVHALMPLALIALYLPLILVLLRKHVINTSRLSFYQIMPMIPDTVFVFNRQGRLTDRSRMENFIQEPLPLPDFCKWIQNHCHGDAKALVAALQNPGTRVRGEISCHGPSPQRVWSFSCQALHKKGGQKLGVLVVLSDVSESRMASRQLQEKNETLNHINRQLSDYSEVIENYAGASTQQEVSMIIDATVRDRLDTVCRNLQAAKAAPSWQQNPCIAAMLDECRQSLADIRHLVRRLSGRREES